MRFFHTFDDGGEGGIRTHGTGFSPYNRLAGGCLKPTRPPLQAKKIIPRN